MFLFQENGNPDGVVYTEVNIGKDGKPRPKERNSIKKKVNLTFVFLKMRINKKRFLLELQNKDSRTQQSLLLIQFLFCSFSKY